jgi:hypothetical protein
VRIAEEAEDKLSTAAEFKLVQQEATLQVGSGRRVASQGDRTLDFDLGVASPVGTR